MPTLRVVPSLLIPSLVYCVSLPAHADLTVRPQNFAPQATVINHLPGALYDAQNGPATPPAITPDLTQTQALDPTLGDALSLNVTSSLTHLNTPAGQMAALVVYAQGAAGFTKSARLAPIAGLGWLDCALTRCLPGVGGLSLPDRGVAHYFAAPYAVGATLEVRLYPRDVCRDYALQSTGNLPAQGCTAGGDVQIVPHGKKLIPMPLTWAIVNVDSQGVIQGAPLDQGVFMLSFQAPPASSSRQSP